MSSPTPSIPLPGPADARETPPANACQARTRPAPGSCPALRPCRGFAISLILVAIAVLALMGAIIAYSTRLGSELSSHNADIADAMLLVNQMSNIREGIKVMVARGVPLEHISLDSNDGTTPSAGYAAGFNTTGLYHPSLGATETQVVPRRLLDASFSGSTSTYYTWHLVTDTSGKAVIKLNNIGSSAPEWLVALVGLKVPVCQQINKIINGVSTNNKPVQAPASGTGATSPDDWAQRPSSTTVDMSGVPGMDKMEQCFLASDGTPVYYAVIKAG